MADPISLGAEAKIIVGKGAYTEIVSIEAPSEAVPGSVVNITAKIKNLYASTIGIMAGGALEYSVSPWPTIDFSPYWANVPGGVIQPFAGSFIMPDSDITIHAYSYYYSGTSWYLDDERTIRIRQQLAEPKFSNLSATYRRV